MRFTDKAVGLFCVFYQIVICMWVVLGRTRTSTLSIGQSCWDDALSEFDDT